MRNFNTIRVVGLSFAVVLGGNAVAGCGGSEESSSGISANQSNNEETVTVDNNNELLIEDGEHVGVVPGVVELNSGEFITRPRANTGQDNGCGLEDGGLIDDATEIEYVKNGKRLKAGIDKIKSLIFRQEVDGKFKKLDAQNEKALLRQCITPEGPVEDREHQVCVPVGVDVPNSERLRVGRVYQNEGDAIMGLYEQC
jgi:hypothetical protein